MQKRQMMWMMGMLFAVIVAAAVFSAFLINNVVNGRVASALDSEQRSNPTVYVQPANASSDNCAAPTGGSGGEGISASAGDGTMAMVGGRGGAPAEHAAVGGRGGDASADGGSTITYTISHTRNVNSNNVLGSYNGSNNTATTNNTQGSYNTVSGDGDLSQVNLAENKAKNDSDVTIEDSANTEDSNNNEVKIEDSGNDNSDKSTTETNNETHVNSHNDIDATPLLLAS